MTKNAHELGVSVGAWNALVRRARIGRARKAGCLVVSSYADADGTDIHCGVARLAVDLEVSYSTAKRILAWMRSVGLIELVRAGNRRRNLSDEYRLILGPDVLEEIHVLDPDEHSKLADNIREANRGGPNRSDQGSSIVTPDQGPPATETGTDHGSPKVTRKTGIRGQNEVDQGSSLCEPPPSLSTSPKDLPPRKPTDDGDLRTDLALVGAPGSEAPSVVVEIFPGASQEPPFVTAPPGRRLSRAQQTVAEATARTEARRAAHRATKEAK